MSKYFTDFSDQLREACNQGDDKKALQIVRKILSFQKKYNKVVIKEDAFACYFFRGNSSLGTFKYVYQTYGFDTEYNYSYFISTGMLPKLRFLMEEKIADMFKLFFLSEKDTREDLWVKFLIQCGESDITDCIISRKCLFFSNENLRKVIHLYKDFKPPNFGHNISYQDEKNILANLETLYNHNPETLRKILNNGDCGDILIFKKIFHWVKEKFPETKLTLTYYSKYRDLEQLENIYENTIKNIGDDIELCHSITTLLGKSENKPKHREYIEYIWNKIGREKMVQLAITYSNTKYVGAYSFTKFFLPLFRDEEIEKINFNYNVLIDYDYEKYKSKAPESYLFHTSNNVQDIEKYCQKFLEYEKTQATVFLYNYNLFDFSNQKIKFCLDKFGLNKIKAFESLCRKCDSEEKLIRLEDFYNSYLSLSQKQLKTIFYNTLNNTGNIISCQWLLGKINSKLNIGRLFTNRLYNLNILDLMVENIHKFHQIDFKTAEKRAIKMKSQDKEHYSTLIYEIRETLPFLFK